MHHGRIPMKLRFALKNHRHLIKRFLARSNYGRISVGRYTYGEPKIRWWGEAANLTIGKFCSIAEGVEIFLGGNHRTDWISTFPFSVMREWPDARGIKGHPGTNGDVAIGNDVWLGAGSVILSGVTIGNGAVVGCRSVVTRSVPDYAIVAGNPAKVVRMRFSPETIRRLVESRWWDWNPARIRRHMRLMLSTDVEAFLKESATDHDR
jgi:acetyltransferase-like isoleucine patch superfamily enzyme